MSTPRSERDEGSGHAQLLGIWGVAGFIGLALGPLLSGPLLFFVGSQQGNEMEEYSRRGYAAIFSLAAARFFFSAVTLRFIKNPNV